MHFYCLILTLGGSSSAFNLKCIKHETKKTINFIEEELEKEETANLGLVDVMRYSTFQ